MTTETETKDSTPAGNDALSETALKDATAQSKRLQTELDNITAELMLSGQQIPTHEQSNVSSLQRKYLQTASALGIANDKKVLLQNRLQETQRRQVPET